MPVLKLVGRSPGESWYCCLGFRYRCCCEEGFCFFDHNEASIGFQGYIFVLLNDFATAVNGVVTKKKLDSKDLGSAPSMFLQI